MVQSPLLAWTPALIDAAMMPLIALTDQQLDTVRRIAATLQVRDAFLREVAAALREHRVLGDGLVCRVCLDVSRRFWWPPEVEE